MHDLAIAEAVAGREKDLAFLECLARTGLARAQTLEERLAATSLPDGVRVLVSGRIRHPFGPRP